MDVEAGVRPFQHRLGLMVLEEAAPDEELEHGAAKRLGELGDIMTGPG